MEPSAGARILVGEDDPEALCGSDTRGHQPGGTRADDEHVAEGVALLVAVGIGKMSAAPETRRLANEALAEMPGSLTGPHEGLVVEAGREQRRQPVIHRHHVEGEGGPAVLARRLQPLVQLGHGGAGVGLVPGAGAHLDQRVRLLRTGAHDAARTMILEGAADQNAPGGKQRRGERVAGKAVHRLTVEAEGERTVALDMGATTGKPVAAHAPCPSRRAASPAKRPAISTLVISWVSVLRVTRSQ